MVCVWGGGGYFVGCLPFLLCVCVCRGGLFLFFVSGGMCLLRAGFLFKFISCHFVCFVVFVLFLNALLELIKVGS